MKSRYTFGRGRRYEYSKRYAGPTKSAGDITPRRNSGGVYEKPSDGGSIPTREREGDAGADTKGKLDLSTVKRQRAKLKIQNRREK